MATSQSQRLDKWLWAARFFKTRALAVTAISGGKVHVNDERVKPARALRVGDRLTISRGQETIAVVVQGLNPYRRPFKEASLLYEETVESRQRREHLAEQRRLEQTSRIENRRPDKRGRRKIREFYNKF